MCRALVGGADPRKTGTLVHSEGSYGNGAVVRIAPIALMFRECSAEVLRTAVYECCLPTHVHPDAKDAAYLQARAVVALSGMDDSEMLQPLAFLDALLRDATTIRARELLVHLFNFFKECSPPHEDDHQAMLHDLEFTSSPDMCKYSFTSDGAFQIHAAEALACSLYFLLRYPSPERAMIGCVSMGGDADTTAAILGCLLGSLHGTNLLPARWLDEIEDHHTSPSSEPKWFEELWGKRMLIRDADRCAALYCTAYCDQHAM
eukprot:TRINITY_DN3774_c0_g1_i1.p1 TRINITY_DN3774_c0_g1~~TRINITY_DN3774_c0_g1_i1.p1  ORF type:complete len:261 (+),score=41.95 TRINITY_DN3774_c0_g1_i1:388-1170(+)